MYIQVVSVGWWACVPPYSSIQTIEHATTAKGIASTIKGNLEQHIDKHIEHLLAAFKPFTIP